MTLLILYFSVDVRWPLHGMVQSDVDTGRRLYTHFTRINHLLEWNTCIFIHV
jgi:hypothetical protein